MEPGGRGPCDDGVGTLDLTSFCLRVELKRNLNLFFNCVSTIPNEAQTMQKQSLALLRETLLQKLTSTCSTLLLFLLCLQLICVFSLNSSNESKQQHALRFH